MKKNTLIRDITTRHTWSMSTFWAVKSILVILVIILICYLGIAFLWLIDRFVIISDFVAGIYIVVVILGGALLLTMLVAIPWRKHITWRTNYKSKRYSKVRQTIDKNADELETLFKFLPAIELEDETYFLALYYWRSTFRTQEYTFMVPNGILLIRADGVVVEDEQIFEQVLLLWSIARRGAFMPDITIRDEAFHLDNSFRNVFALLDENLADAYLHLDGDLKLNIQTLHTEVKDYHVARADFNKIEAQWWATRWRKVEFSAEEMQPILDSGDRHDKLRQEVRASVITGAFRDYNNKYKQQLATYALPPTAEEGINVLIDGLYQAEIESIDEDEKAISDWKRVKASEVYQSRAMSGHPNPFSNIFIAIAEDFLGRPLDSTTYGIPIVAGMNNIAFGLYYDVWRKRTAIATKKVLHDE